MTPKTRLMKTADKLWKEKILKRANGRCEICGNPALTAHHFVRRSRCSLLKYDLANGVAVCGVCHCKFDVEHDVFVHIKIAVKRGQKWVDYLEKKVIENRKKQSYSFKTIDYYKKVIKELNYEKERDKISRS